MDAATAVQTANLILAPVVMVTACAAILNGLLSRYGAINDRLRTLARERLELLHACGGVISAADPLGQERLQEIDTQAPALLHRHRSVRDAMLLLYVAIVLFIISMFVIALATALRSTGVAIGALIDFLGATTVMLIGAIFSLLEVRISHRAMHYEVERVLALGKK